MKSVKNEIWDKPSMIPYASLPEKSKYQVWNGVDSIEFLSELLLQIELKYKNEIRV